MPERTKDLLSGLLLAALALAVWFYAGTFPDLDAGHPGPALFPRVVAVGVLVAGLALVAGGVLRRQTPPATLEAATAWARPEKAGAMRLTIGLILVVLYPWLLAFLGFVPTLSLLGFFVAYALKARLLTALATALLSTLAIYALFTRLLHVPL